MLGNINFIDSQNVRRYLTGISLTSLHTSGADASEINVSNVYFKSGGFKMFILSLVASK